jgi:hypothetical protein
MIGGHEAVLGVATCHDELIEVLRARKASLGLSNELLDHLMPAASGHTDKLLGPSQERGLSRSSLDGMLSALGLQLLVAIDPVQSARMQPQWERRDVKQVRPPARLAASVIKRARPQVLSQLARKAGSARWRGISPELRSRLMRELAKARWHADTSA